VVAGIPVGRGAGLPSPAEKTFRQPKPIVIFKSESPITSIPGGKDA